LPCEWLQKSSRDSNGSAGIVDQSPPNGRTVNVRTTSKAARPPLPNCCQFYQQVRESFLEWQRRLLVTSSSKSRALDSWTGHVLNCATSIFTSTSDINCVCFSSHSVLPVAPNRTTHLAIPARTTGDRSSAVTSGPRGRSPQREGCTIGGEHCREYKTFCRQCCAGASFTFRPMWDWCSSGLGGGQPRSQRASGIDRTHSTTDPSSFHMPETLEWCLWQSWGWQRHCKACQGLCQDSNKSPRGRYSP